MNLKVFAEIERKFKVVTDQMETFVRESLEEEKKYTVDLNREQLSRGMNADETPIEPGYKPRTVAIKKRKGQPFDRVTLKDTGDFHRGMKLSTFQKEFVLSSTDWKINILVPKYGARIFGVPQSKKHELQQRLKPRLIKAVKSKF
jgi:hypothetical protein